MIKVPLLGIVFFIILFALPIDSHAEKYQNQEYGFEIDFPDGWYLDDYLITYEPIPGYDEGSASLVGIFDDSIFWNHVIEVGFIKNDVIAINYEGQEYLDRFGMTLAEYCQTATLDYDEFTCSDYQIIESKMIKIDGIDAYHITESWIETYSDQSTFEVIGISVNIPVNDNVWTITTSSLKEEYDSVKSQISDSIDSFRFTNNGAEPELNYSELGDVSEMFSFLQPITSQYSNSDAGVEIDFPQNWEGIQMEFPKELFEGIMASEMDGEIPDEAQEELLDFLTSTTMVMAFPADATTQENTEMTNMMMMMIVDNFAVENLTDTLSQSMAMSSSPDSAYEGLTEDNPDCEIHSSKIIWINNMKAYEIDMSCIIVETNQTMNFLLYMFGTDKDMILLMNIGTDNTKLSDSLKTLKIKDTIDMSDPYTYSEMYGMTVEEKTVQKDGKTHDIAIVSTGEITDFEFNENAKTIQFTPLLNKGESFGYTDIHIKDLISEPFTVTLDGQESDIMWVTEDTTTDRTILSLEYSATFHEIMIKGGDKTEEIPTWVKSNAEWWASGVIDDKSFVQGIEFMIKEEIIIIPETSTNVGSISNEIPTWVKSNADWWSKGLISDQDFVKGIQFMIESGIITIN